MFGQVIKVTIAVVFGACMAQTQTISDGCPPNCFCTNGMGPSGQVTQASCSGSVPPTVPDTLRYLSTRNSRIPSLSPLMFEKLGKVEVLHLTQCGIEDIQPNTFSGMKNVKVIKLSHNKLTQIQAVMLGGLGGLREFYCDNNQIRFVENSAFSNLPELQVLDLQNNLMYQMPTGFPSKLQTLNLEGNFIEYLPPTTLGPNMKQLNLCGNRFHEINFDPRAGTMPHLDKLCVGNMPSIISPTTFEYLKDLKDLSLSCEMSPNSILPDNVVKGISSLVSLQTIKLAYYRFESLEFIAPLNALQSIKLYNIMSRVNLTESVFKGKRNLLALDLAGSPYLAQTILHSNVLLQQLHSVQSLGLSHCQIHSIDATTWTTNMLNINQIDLSNNPIHCDCRLKWIVMHDKDRPIRFVDEKETICASPPEFANKPVTEFTFKSCFELNGTMPDKIKPGDVPTSAMRQDPGAVQFPEEVARTRKSLIVVIVILAILLGIVMIAFIIYAVCFGKKKKVKEGSVAYQSSRDSLIQK